MPKKTTTKPRATFGKPTRKPILQPKQRPRRARRPVGRVATPPTPADLLRSVASYAFVNVRRLAGRGGMLFTMKQIEQWQFAVSTEIHKPAKALYRALVAAGFGK
jgi:hypothetical protein